MPAPGFAFASRPASPRAPTASVAMAATVIAVPSPITKVDATPIQNSPCASANTSTMIAPEQGRKPTATIAGEPAPAASAGRSAPAAPARARGPRPRPRPLVVIVVMRVDDAMAIVRCMHGRDEHDRVS